jgi:hypothetical protein
MINSRNAYATQPMKTATFPSLRVEPALRDAAESVLREGETLTSLIETSVRETIQRRRRTQSGWIPASVAMRVISVRCAGTKRANSGRGR